MYGIPIHDNGERVLEGSDFSEKKKDPPSIDRHLYNPDRTRRKHLEYQLIRTHKQLAAKTKLSYRLKNSSVFKSQYFPSLVGNTGTPWNPSGFGKAIVVLMIVGLAITASWIFPMNPLWHSSTIPAPQAHIDPTTPVQKYSAAAANLAEFNTAGTVTYTTSCGAIGTIKCMKLAATTALPSLSGMFTLPAGNLKITGATINPETPAMRYHRVTGISTNHTFFFDVSGGQAQAGTWIITTTATTTVTFQGPQPNPVTCPGCASAAYSNGEEVLIFGPGVSSSSFSLTWPTGQNFNFLGAMAESLTPVGDLSPVVAKELETTLFWSPITNASTTIGTSAATSWGFFLTTNATLWQTNNPTWTPYDDASVALFVKISRTGSTSYSETLYIQRNPADTIHTEDTGSCSGSQYICVTATMSALGSFSAISYFDLNYTGSSNAAQGGAVNPCQTTNNAANGPSGGPACSFLTLFESGVQGSTGSTPNSPPFSLSAQSYYIGYWLGSSQTGSGMYYCFDTGSPCGSQTTFITNGCTGSSMEIDYCIPTPLTASQPPPAPTTDSGGFFGSVWRGLTGIGNVLSGGLGAVVHTVTAPLGGIGTDFLGTIISGLTNLIGLLQQALIFSFNTVGNFFGLGNVGTALSNFFAGVGTFFSSVFSTVFNNFSSAITWFSNSINLLGVQGGNIWSTVASAIAAINSWGTGSWTVLTAIGLVGQISVADFVFIDLMIGALMAFRGLAYWKQWFDFNGKIMMDFFKAFYWFLDQSGHIIARIKGLLWPGGGGG